MTAGDSSYVYSGFSQTVVSGQDVISKLRERLEQLNSSRVMMIHGNSIFSRSNVTQRVESALGNLYVGRFAGSSPHAAVDVLNEALEVATEFRPDTLLSVGGGSSTTIAKGVALLLGTNHTIEDFRIRYSLSHGVELPQEPLPEPHCQVVAVSTTMGCAEIGPTGGSFTDPDSQEKFLVVGDGRTSPKLVMVDGDALLTTPRAVQVATTVGQLRMAIETVLAMARNPFGDALALRSIALLVPELKSGWHQNADYLLRIKAACIMASLGRLAARSNGLNTAIAHQLGAICGVPHGEANSVLLPHSLRFNARTPNAGMNEIASAFGFNELDSFDAGLKVADAVKEMCCLLGIPDRLRDVGVSKADIEIVASSVMRDRGLASNPRKIENIQEIISILNDAW